MSAPLRRSAWKAWYAVEVGFLVSVFSTTAELTFFWRWNLGDSDVRISVASQLRVSLLTYGFLT
jgi:hypothetical protein